MIVTIYVIRKVWFALCYLNIFIFIYCAGYHIVIKWFKFILKIVAFLFVFK